MSKYIADNYTTKVLFSYLPRSAIKAVLMSSILSFSATALAVDTDSDGIEDVLDAAPHDADLQKITINHVINGDFEAGANYWAPNASQASYSSVNDSFDGSKAIEVTTTKNNKGLFSTQMTGNGSKSITVNLWAKVTNAANPFKIKVILKQPDGSAKADKFLNAILVDDNDDPDPADDTVIINASEWTPISKTFDLTAIQQEATDNDLDGDPATNFTYIDLDADGNYHEYIKLMIQPVTAGDTILVDNVTLYTGKDKTAMLLNAVTDTDSDSLMDDNDPHPTMAYHSELKATDDFDNDGIINSNDAQPYNPQASADLNNDGYADSQTAPLINAFSPEFLELTDAEQDNWSVIKFISSKESIVGETSFKVTNSATSKAKIVTLAANNQVTLGFWAKTDASGIAADGEAFAVKARFIAANDDASDVFLTQSLDNTNLTEQWQYFQIEKNLTDTQTVTDTEIIFLKPSVANAANIWIDGVVVFTDPDADALLATQRDTDTDGIFDYWDNDDDNDGLKDGEDISPLTAIGSYDLPDIDQDGNEDTADTNLNGVLDYFEDITAPVITLVGDDTVTLTEGETYTDAGATALDETDGDVSINISIINPVDTSIPGTYLITYNVADAASNTAIEVTRTIIVEALPDITVPVITLLGEATVTLTEGETYTDAGATALDELDGDITNNITVVNLVNTAVPGTYTVTYGVTDADNNVAIEVVRTVIVEAFIDLTVPVITLLGNASVTITAGDVYTDAGATALDELDGDISNNITVVNSVNSAIPGIYSVTYNVTDANNNVAIEVIRTVIVGAIIDITIPVITLLGETTVTITEGGTYIDAGATALDAVDGDISNNLTVVNSVNAAVPGTYAVTYNVSDADNNAAIEVVRTVIVEAIPEEVNVITIIPSADITLEATAANMTVNLTEPTITNSKAGVTATISHNAPETFAVGETTIIWTAKDSNGNTLSAEQKITIVDSSAPVFDSLADINFEKANANSAITLTPPMASDNIDGQITATTDFENGVYQPGRSYVITWQATDNAGNTTTATQNLTITSATAEADNEEAQSNSQSSGGSLSFAWLLLLVTASVRKLVFKK